MKVKVCFLLLFVRMYAYRAEIHMHREYLLAVCTRKVCRIEGDEETREKFEKCIESSSPRHYTYTRKFGVPLCTPERRSTFVKYVRTPSVHSPTPARPFSLILPTRNIFHRCLSSRAYIFRYIRDAIGNRTKAASLCTNWKASTSENVRRTNARMRKSFSSLLVFNSVSRPLHEFTIVPMDNDSAFSHPKTLGINYFLALTEQREWNVRSCHEQTFPTCHILCQPR